MKNHLILLSLLFSFTFCTAPDIKKEKKEEIVIGVLPPDRVSKKPRPYIPECVPTNDSIVPFDFEEKLDKIKLVSYFKMKISDYIKKEDVTKEEGIYAAGNMTKLYNIGKGFKFENFKSQIDLNVDQQSQLLCVLQSYNQAESHLHSADCYDPHHCIFFLDKKERILGYIEICFGCSNVIDSMTDYEITCNDQLNELQTFFVNTGFRIR